MSEPQLSSPSPNQVTAAWMIDSDGAEELYNPTITLLRTGSPLLQKRCLNNYSPVSLQGLKSLNEESPKLTHQISRPCTPLANHSTKAEDSNLLLQNSQINTNQGFSETQSTNSVLEVLESSIFTQEGNGTELTDKRRKSRPSQSIARSVQSIEKPKEVLHQNENNFFDRWFSVWTMSLFLLAVLTRFMGIDQPSATVFDEIHTGQQINQYFAGSYFVTVFPPLGALIFYGLSVLCGYNGTHPFSNIGQDYLLPSGPFFIGLRSFSALFGSLLIPLLFVLLKDLSLSTSISALACLFLIFDNGFINISKWMIIDSFSLFLVLSSCYLLVQMKQIGGISYNTMTALGIVLGLGISSKITFVYTWIFAFISLSAQTIHDMIQRSSLRRSGHLYSRIKALALGLLIVPFLLYLCFVYIHLSLLPYNGSGSPLMSGWFQSTLSSPNQLSSAELANSAKVFPGSIVSLQNVAEPVFLHSFNMSLPQLIQEKVSSQGQVVSGYPNQNLNTLWVIEHALDEEIVQLWGVSKNQLKSIPEPIKRTETDENGQTVEILEHDQPEEMPEDDQEETELTLEELIAKTTATASESTAKAPAIKHGSIVRLRHFMTGKYLLTHDVASPLTRTHMETVCFDCYESKQSFTVRYPFSLWRVEFVAISHDSSISAEQAMKTFTDLSSSVITIRFIHHKTNGIFRNHRQSYPQDAPWGLGQREINSIKNENSPNCQWKIPFVFGRTAPAQPITPPEPMIISKLGELIFSITNKPSYSSWNPLNGFVFIGKFLEHQLLFWKIILFPQAPPLSGPGSPSEHPYATRPYQWPFLVKGISLWDQFVTKRQIYWLGNPFVWFLLAVVMVISFVYSVVNLLKKTRAHSTLILKISSLFLNTTHPYVLIWFGYICHYLPYFVFYPAKSTVLLTTSYMPAFLFSLLIAATTLESLLLRFSLKVRIAFISVILSWTLVAFWIFAPLTYGWPLTTEQGEARTWLSTWKYLVTLYPSK